jgi:ATP-dependent exoDNAse (exonuclease V) beta subunit
MREGGTRRGEAEVTFFDSPKLTFDARSGEPTDGALPVDGGEAEATQARAAEDAWKTARKTQRAAGRGAPGPQRLLAEATASEEEDAGAAADRTAASRAEEHAAAFGRLVHALLALPEPLEGEALEQAARTHRLEFGLSPTEAAEAAELAGRAQTLPAVAVAREADTTHRELPFTCRLDGRQVSGRIDLAYRKDGAWTVIDFKTARLTDPAQAEARYRDQMTLYRTALSALTGEPVAAALCLVRTGELVSV